MNGNNRPREERDTERRGARSVNGNHRPGDGPRHRTGGCWAVSIRGGGGRSSGQSDSHNDELDTCRCAIGRDTSADRVFCDVGAVIHSSCRWPSGAGRARPAHRCRPALRPETSCCSSRTPPSLPIAPLADCRGSRVRRRRPCNRVGGAARPGAGVGDASNLGSGGSDGRGIRHCRSPRSMVPA